MKTLLFPVVLFFLCVSSFGQSFSIQNNNLSISGLHTVNDFNINTYLDALSNTTVFWEVVADSVPSGWEYSNCFPTCYPIGTTSGTLSLNQGQSYYLNAHFYPNNVSGEGYIVMKIEDNSTVEYVSWTGIAGSLTFINSSISSTNKEIKQIINLNGQIVDYFESGNIYIVVYNDNSVAKIFATE